MKYTIYKIINQINNKIYIGKHQTSDLNDNYMGSGKMLKRAIDKHGIENFKKEILHIFDNEDDMNAKEAELVTEQFCSRDDTYNLCPGGHGGWGYVNSLTTKEYKISHFKNISHLGAIATVNSIKMKCEQNLEYKKYYSKIQSLKSKGRISPFKGKKHSEESKEKMKGSRISFSGKRNSQFGTMWITDGSSNKKIKKIDTIPEGWYKGRILNTG